MSQLEKQFEALSFETTIQSAAFVDLDQSISSSSSSSTPTIKPELKSSLIPTTKDFWQTLLSISWTKEEIDALRQMVKNTVDESKLQPTPISGDYVTRLLVAYNQHFFNFQLLEMMKHWQIRLSVNVQPKLDQGRYCQCILRSRNKYCISFSQQFDKLFTQGESSLSLGTLKCNNRVEAIMFSLEHELLHLSEMMAFDCSTTTSPFSPCSVSPAMITSTIHSNDFKQVQVQWFGQGKCVHKFVKGDADELEMKQNLLQQMRTILQIGDEVIVQDPKTKTQFHAVIEKLNPKNVKVLLLPDKQHTWAGSYSCIQKVNSSQ